MFEDLQREISRHTILMLAGVFTKAFFSIIMDLIPVRTEASIEGCPPWRSKSLHGRSAASYKLGYRQGRLSGSGQSRGETKQWGRNLTQLWIYQSPVITLSLAPQPIAKSSQQWP